MCPIEVFYWAEGPTDRAAARRLISAAGAIPGADYSKRTGAAAGKDYLDANIHRFNAAAAHKCWLVLRDSDGVCAKDLVHHLIAEPSPLMRLRIVVPAIEAWLMADRDVLADYLAVSVARIPAEPEGILDIKERLVEIVSHSRSRSIREEMLPAMRSGRRQGPGYSNVLIEFINNRWDPDRSSRRADSLRRSLCRLRQLVRT